MLNVVEKAKNSLVGTQLIDLIEGLPVYSLKCEFASEYICSLDRN